MIVSGLRTFPEDKIREDAPKPNDWVQEITREYTGQNGDLQAVSWGGRTTPECKVELDKV
jgi:hypothetical protein